ncbi:hypothetical protein E2C01_002568 [Portunus trituberculatus]|uniref:Uncharacterized protein n=1 Tax=Portunus trituberculatus TaxID=210409 RepID=A0A5B7CLK5_PORTR|nr:hypothetical protein [Portunus trituberculatus]
MLHLNATAKQQRWLAAAPSTLTLSPTLNLSSIEIIMPEARKAAHLSWATFRIATRRQAPRLPSQW